MNPAMRSLVFRAMLVPCLLLHASGQWQEQNSGTQVQLRGISAVSRTVAWASGADGTILRTVDEGKNWKKLSVDGAEKLDFRDIRGFDDKTAYVLSIGPGELSQIYKTADGGLRWQLQFTNRDPKAFYDCFAFWDSDHGIAVSDSVDGKFPLLVTADGAQWTALAPHEIPAALPKEGAFAASGTCIATQGKEDVWFATGGPVARVFHSQDQGRNWTVANTPIQSGAPSQGIFSLAFWDRKHGVVVGGDYMHPENAEKTAAYTSDGGQTWTLSGNPPSGYRSAAAAVLDGTSANSPAKVLAVGTTGTDSSCDGSVWMKESEGAYNAVSFFGGSGWAVGPQGRIAHAEIPFCNDLDAVLKEMDLASARFSSAQADFEWDNYQKVVDETEKQAGRVYFRRSGRKAGNVTAMFEVATPAEKQLLFKSGEIQLYNAKIDQITEYKPGKTKADVQAFLSLGFGAAGSDLLQSYDVKLAGWETVDGVRTAKLQLTARSPRIRNMFSQFVLWIDPKRDVPLKQQVIEPSGDYWLSHYKNFVLGKTIPEERFRILRTSRTKVVTP
jgi:photosystem II stability/assembly factor-like uncharacterized protein/outer membrane lipoprotein-sorting protein